MINLNINGNIKTYVVENDDVVAAKEKIAQIIQENL